MNYTALKTTLTSIAKAAGIKTVLFWNEVAVSESNLFTDDYPYIVILMPNHTIKAGIEKFRTPFEFYIGVKRTEKSSNLDVHANDIVDLCQLFVGKINESEKLIITSINGDTQQGYGYFVGIDTDISFKYNSTLEIWCNLI